MNAMTDSDTGEPESIFRLIYRSRSLIGSDAQQSELGAIFTTARANNRSLGVTGALVISDDAFVQALEGPEAVVRDLYASISQDSRHDSVTVLEEKDVEARLFGRWAMAKVAADGGSDIRLLSNSSRRMIVEAPGADRSITPDQESVLTYMRASLSLDPSKK